MIYSRTCVNSILHNHFTLSLVDEKIKRNWISLIHDDYITSITGEIAGETFIVCRKHRDECRRDLASSTI